MKILCFLVGHKYDKEAYYYSYVTCERCGRDFTEHGCEMSAFHDFGCLTPFYRAKFWFRRKFYTGYKWDFLPRCDTCGKVSFKNYCSKKCKENCCPF
jgi:hypothetical protein